MSRYLAPVQVGGSYAIAVCPRCKMKRYYGDLVEDPNTKQMLCKFGCVDIYDPYRLPPKAPDQFTLQYPRPDEPLVMPQEQWSILNLFLNDEYGLWYDPSDFSTLYQDSNGITKVTSVGQMVGLMLDKSGNGNHASQPVDSLKPVLQMDVNGNFYLLFDDIDDFMVIPTLDLNNSSELGVWAAVISFSSAQQSFILGTSSE
jgi:hypothetical protein